MRQQGVDGSYLNRWASWASRWAPAPVRRPRTRCGPLSASHACAEIITASPVLVIPTAADPATPCYGGVALAQAFGLSVNLLTSGVRTAFKRSPCVAEHVTLYLVELRVSGGHAC
jgi:hypothetical protein